MDERARNRLTVGAIIGGAILIVVMTANISMLGVTLMARGELVEEVIEESQSAETLKERTEKTVEDLAVLKHTVGLLSATVDQLQDEEANEP